MAMREFFTAMWRTILLRGLASLVFGVLAFVYPGVTLAVVVSMFFIRRPWCGALCPLGAIFGLFSRISMFSVRFYPGRCRECGLCDKTCAYGVDSAVRADDPRCIRCLECARCKACEVAPAWKP